jgi:antitoxin HigA-1
MVRVPTDRQPTHPGEVLLEEFLLPLGITQRRLADAIRVPYQRVIEIVNRRRGITPSTALRLARFFGNSPSFWLDLQMRWDLFQAQDEEQGVLDSIPPFRPPPDRPVLQVAEPAPPESMGTRSAAASIK